MGFSLDCLALFLFPVGQFPSIVHIPDADFPEPLMVAVQEVYLHKVE